MTVDDQLAVIARLWSAGLPLSQIASELGEATRSAIAGKVARARRKGDDRFPTRPFGPRPAAGRISRPATTHPRQRPKSVVAAASPSCFTSPGKTPAAGPRELLTLVTLPLRPAPAIAPAPVEQAGRLLINLDSTDCRWPVGAASDGRHLFCGRPQAPGRPYCPQCCARLSPSPASPSSPFRAPVLRRGGA
jgi:GcrA cell cycle regulator